VVLLLAVTADEHNLNWETTTAAVPSGGVAEDPISRPRAQSIEPSPPPPPPLPEEAKPTGKV